MEILEDLWKSGVDAYQDEKVPLNTTALRLGNDYYHYHSTIKTTQNNNGPWLGCNSKKIHLKCVAVVLSWLRFFCKNVVSQ